jgi:hypothetical protein
MLKNEIDETLNTVMKNLRGNKSDFFHLGNFIPLALFRDKKFSYENEYKNNKALRKMVYLLEEPFKEIIKEWIDSIKNINSNLSIPVMRFRIRPELFKKIHDLQKELFTIKKLRELEKEAEQNEIKSIFPLLAIINALYMILYKEGFSHPENSFLIYLENNPNYKVDAWENNTSNEPTSVPSQIKESYEQYKTISFATFMIIPYIGSPDLSFNPFYTNSLRDLGNRMFYEITNFVKPNSDENEDNIENIVEKAEHVFKNTLSVKE